MDTLWDVADIARYYKVTEAAIRNKIKRRCDTIPMPRKHGRNLRWKPEEVYAHTLTLPKLGTSPAD